MLYTTKMKPTAKIGDSSSQTKSLLYSIYPSYNIIKLNYEWNDLLWKI